MSEWDDADLTTEDLPTKNPLWGWPLTATCECGGKLVRLHSTYVLARYECKGAPEPRPTTGAYSKDRCGRVFKVFR